jgi:hypothetical protein
MMTKTERWSTQASGCSHGSSRPLGEAAVDVAKRFCMIPVPRRAWLVGLALAVGITWAAGGSASADDRGLSVPIPNFLARPPGSPSFFKKCDNQTYALCAVASCFVFNQVAYCKCDVKFGDSISLPLEFDDGQDVCTVNAEGAANGYMVSTFSVPDSVLKPHGDQAIYTCPRTLDGAYAQCDGGICFTSSEGQSFPGFDEPLAKDQIICSCPITVQNPETARVGYQITGPYPCQKSFFENCNSTTANNKTGSTIYVGAPTGTPRLLAFLLTGTNPPVNECRLPRD